jgi:hypothetical protein
MPNPQNRVTAPLKLFRGTDADLIQWLDSIPKGQRNGAVKNALRRGLGMPERVMSQSVAALELERITGELDTLKSAVARVPTMLKSMPTAAPAPDQVKRIDAIEDYLNGVDGWLQGFQQQLDQISAALTSGAPISHLIDQQEAAGRLSDDEVSEIEANLLKNSW